MVVYDVVLTRPSTPVVLKRAKAGDRDAQFELACHYDFDPPKRKKLAIQWYSFHWLSRAAEAGDAPSQCSLGVCYHEGHGVRRDFLAAVNWYRTAAEQGDDWAMYLLGLCYRDGEGVRANRRLARTWLLKAARLKVREAKTALARLSER